MRLLEKRDAPVVNQVGDLGNTANPGKRHDLGWARRVDVVPSDEDLLDEDGTLEVLCDLDEGVDARERDDDDGELRRRVSEALLKESGGANLLDGRGDVLGGDGEVVAERLLLSIDWEVVAVVGEVSSPARRRRVSSSCRRPRGSRAPDLRVVALAVAEPGLEKTVPVDDGSCGDFDGRASPGKSLAVLSLLCETGNVHELREGEKVSGGFTQRSEEGLTFQRSSRTL